MATAKAKCFHGGRPEEYEEGAESAYAPARTPGVMLIDRETWKKKGMSVKVLRDPLPSKDRELFQLILSKSPGRSVGRPPIGDRAMTDAERKQKSRAKEHAE
jgi:hypothetical protein